MSSRIIILTVSLLWGVLAQAQEAPRYLLVEHFTNTRCSLCPNRNATMYQRIGDYPGWVHVISYHPPVPYQDDFFYNQNPTENDTRRMHYSVFGTPQAFLWGANSASGSDLLPSQKVLDNYQQTSPVLLNVSQQISNNMLTATVELETFETPVVSGNGNYRLYVAVIEDTINWSAPNGEDHHYDVFRKMLTDISGDVIALGPVGASVGANFQVAIDNQWISSALQVVAFLTYEDANITFINSGRTGDLAVQTTTTAATNNDGTASAIVSGGVPPYTIMWDNNQTSATINGLAGGDYTVTVTDANNISMQRVVTVAGPTNRSPRLSGISVAEIRSGQWMVSGLPATEAKVSLINLTGQEVNVPLHNQQSRSIQFNTTPLPTGIYVLHVSTDQGEWTQKIAVRN